MRFKLRLVLSLAAFALAVPSVAAAQVKACKGASIVFGNPEYQGQDRPAPTGASVKEDPPLAWRTLTFVGKTVYTNTGQEVWAADLVTGKLRRIAGEQQKGVPRFNEGPCASARLGNIMGMAALPDGSLVAADHGAQAVVKIASPENPELCSVSYLAGTGKPLEAVNNVPPGDKDGAGAGAQLGGPQWPVADASGNVYFIDSKAVKLKMIEAGGDTVTTVAPLPRDEGISGYRGLTLLKGKLYAVTNNLTTGFIVEIDLKGGTPKKILSAKGKHLPEIGENYTAAFSAITNDGKDLFVTGSGFIWRVTTAGKTSFVAGAGSPLEYPKGYRIDGQHTAKTIVLRYRVGDQTALGTNTALTYHDGALYFRGRNYASYVVKIECT
jgi:hypothetical protein